ncbi:MAG: ATP-binding cassette domain-containing protein [Capnocytophaga sp.]|nr:ATP-binding cassette domain-containing protein [Capnocytophaga sp.]
MLEAINVNKFYGKHQALHNISISIPKGSIYGILGPNGAGKTSFIRILNQITYPDSGSILFEGEPLQQKHISDIGYLPEERGLYKSMKVGEQLLYLSSLKGLNKEQAKEQINFWFDRLEIPNWRNKKIQELSKGMAQKIQFIATVIHQPKLLIFDEVFSGLDPINAEVIREQILYLREQGATILFSTHRMESVEEMCDYITLIHQSNKILDGKLVDIKKKYKKNEYQVGIIPKNTAVLEYLSTHFEVREANFQSIYEELKFFIKPKEDITTNELLSLLISQGEITHFSEVIPSVNSIFIQMVKEN